jgi:3-oxoacyl-[acyl-carrier-protein] synthase II
MDLYINGLSCISPQPTFQTSVFSWEVAKCDSARLACIEPDYAHYIDAKASRRMGRLLKYGTTAGLSALRDAEVATPDAITTGTGFGLLDDSGKFLKNVTEGDEGIVSPTAFIQSTHNTVSSNIALSVGCYGHNNTFVHKGFSFESALLDAAMLMEEDPAIQNILAGAYDEITDYSFTIMQRLRLIRDTPISNMDLLQKPGSGTIAGEGAAFFLLSREKGTHTYARLHGTDILYKPRSADRVTSRIEAFLARHRMVLSDIDIVLSGICGDVRRDEMLVGLNDHYFTTQTILAYKHLCGEYMTSSAFAFWLGSVIAKSRTILPETIIRDAHRPCSRILICNAYNEDYAFILLSAEMFS